MNQTSRTFGAKRSAYDKRTLVHDVSTAKFTPLTTGGYIYSPSDIEDQYVVGICTGIDVVQNAEKVLGQKFSPDFHYLCTKKFYDGNWYEGSSNLNSLKVANNIGYLPIALFVDAMGKPYVTEADRNTDYTTYIAKLQAIPIADIERLRGLCINKLTGYAQVTDLSPQGIATAILASKAGIICMYEVDDAWYTSITGQISWATVDIDPIRAPKTVQDGHSITASYFDYTKDFRVTHPNTWGITWNDQNQGNCHILVDQYKMIEAWIPYYGSVPPTSVPFKFMKDLSYGMTDPDIVHLQARLNMPIKYQTGYFGALTLAAVIAYQVAHGIFPQIGYCGPKTRAVLNAG